MAKIDIGKYLALGAGAVAVPAFIGNAVTGFVTGIPTIGTTLANPLVGGVSILGLALAATGVGVVDHFMK